MYRSFQEITSRAKEFGPVNVAVLFPHTADVAQSTAHAIREGLIRPVLVGRREMVASAFEGAGLDPGQLELSERQDPQKAADLCLEMIARGEARFALKGNILTTYLYRALIRKTKELAPDQTPCTMCFHEVQTLDKIFAITDPGVNILPDLETKKKILTNAISILRKLGCKMPRIMALAATRLDGSRSTFSEEAEQLYRLAQEGYFGDCEICKANSIVEAFSHRDIRADEFPDILLVPNIDAGNIVVKSIDHILMGIRQCTTVGAGLITLTPSRSDGYEERMTNIALGVVLSASSSGR